MFSQVFLSIVACVIVPVAGLFRNLLFQALPIEVALFLFYNWCGYDSATCFYFGSQYYYALHHRSRISLVLILCLCVQRIFQYQLYLRNDDSSAICDSFFKLVHFTSAGLQW
jgi:hypothetical protein